MAFVPGSTRDPITGFGQQAANVILSRLESVPPAERPMALRALFTALDPKLARRIERMSTKLHKRGVPAQAALRAALAASLSQGLLDEYKALGRGGRLRPQSIAGLATHNGRHATLAGYRQALGWSVGGALSAVTGAAKTITKLPGATYGATTRTAEKYGKQAIDAVGKLACQVATSSAGQTGAMLAGGTAGAAGAQAAANLCQGKPAGTPAVPFQPPPPAGPPKWVTYAAVGGAALAVILAVR